MKRRFSYSFEEFQTHLAAMPQVMKWEHLHLTSPPTEVGTKQTHWARTGRIVEYFGDCYSDPKEAMYKCHVFQEIHDYISEHFRDFKWHKMVKPGTSQEKAFVSRSLFRAVHFAITKKDRDAVVDHRKVVRLAKAFDALHPYE